jgi:bifunctional UDP-N-acetylglucosamine pyrophosphorylase/glucosamine-1-phosphate N-acetyltransferase
MVKTAAVVLAAGLGKRMKSALPKVAHLAAGRPLVAFPVLAARALECDPIVVVVGHGADHVRAAVTAHAPGAHVVLQPEQRGTADAVACARAVVEQSGAPRVLVLYGDCPLLGEQTLRTLVAKVDGADARLGVLTAVVADPTGYGRLVRGPDGTPLRIVEHKDCTPEERAIREVNSGIYLVEREVLFRLLDQVGDANAQGERYLPDIVETCAQERGVVVVPVAPQEVLGVNSRVDLAQVEQILQARVRRRVMEGGCTLRDPSSTFLDLDVEVGQDVTLGPGVTLRGKTVLRDGVCVEGPAVVVDSVVQERATVKAFSHLEGAHVGPGAIVGPFARLRPHAVLEAEVHVGNFVEVKKTTLKRGAKANHLTYLGDATVGERSNVGAGTITCNYDGHGKHHTEIGAEVFLGSNTVLVAPVTVGDGAYVAAGSVITHDVERDALALGRARQVQKPGRAVDIRKRAKEQAGR